MFSLLVRRLNTVTRSVFDDGIVGLLALIKSYLIYNFKEKWRFIYFELDMKKVPPYELPKIDDSIVIRIAKKEDIAKIKSDIYPVLTPKEENDKRYIERIGIELFKCFIAERNGKILHYFLVFESAQKSPLIQTPIKSTKIHSGDAYLGTAFTAPEARGLWIVPHTLLSIFSYLEHNTDVRRILAIVHKDTPGAEGFYKRLGFNTMNDVTSKNYLSIFLNK